ncbi:hypothetical protein Tsubulata_025745 [Turnera subulata]|uniref:Uncharacterized protein n=1 Tax=Turnera subulata TaxID=218843 RepID=A0A9Q0FI75_9ROSI|nr:hypothetical protein Tsubulata_025745 [Turnera subulata]
MGTSSGWKVGFKSHHHRWRACVGVVWCRHGLSSFVPVSRVSEGAREGEAGWMTVNPRELSRVVADAAVWEGGTSRREPPWCRTQGTARCRRRARMGLMSDEGGWAPVHGEELPPPLVGLHRFSSSFSFACRSCGCLS